MMGFSYGLKGDRTSTTSCSDETLLLYNKGYTLYESILGVTENVLQPYYDASDLMI